MSEPTKLYTTSQVWIVCFWGSTPTYILTNATLGRIRGELVAMVMAGMFADERRNSPPQLLMRLGAGLLEEFEGIETPLVCAMNLLTPPSATSALIANELLDPNENERVEGALFVQDDLRLEVYTYASDGKTVAYTQEDLAQEAIEVRAKLDRVAESVLEGAGLVATSKDKPKVH